MGKHIKYFGSFVFIFWSFNPLAFDNPVPIGAYLNGSLPDEDPSNLVVGQFRMENAFPNLTFNDVSVIVSAPSHDPNHPTQNKLIVGTDNGVIYAFDNDPNVQANEVTTLLDFSSTVYSRGEGIAPTHPRDTWNHFLDGGLLNIVFHPDFGKVGSPNQNYLYMQYTGRINNNNVVIVSRFSMAYNPLRIDPASELTIITVPKRGPSHYGGGMCFDNEGYFYVAFGDGMDPPFNNQANRDYFFNTIQELNSFYGKVLRIDLEQDPTRSHAPTNFLSTAYGGNSGNSYWIPNDNPFNGIGGALEEIYTIGNRAPHRMTYDPVEDRIWEGEVGWNTREEVNIIEAGKNYQWPRFEGNLNNGQNFSNYNGSFPYGSSQAPTWDIVRPGGRYALIGGHVYRGNNLPALTGRYICGMFGSGDIYALTLNPQTGLSSRTIIANKPGDREIHTFGLDQQGEIYAGGNSNDRIYKLVDPSNQSSPIPGTLSATGAFSNLTNLTPNPGIIPYEPKNSFWSDGAEKYRWIAVPNDGDHNTAQEDIIFSEEGNWQYPIGTVFIKHFEFEISPNTFKKIETRFLVRDKNGNYFGLSYKWRDDQTDADLVGINGETETLQTIFGQHEWIFPGRTTCMNCHTGSKGFVLGNNTWQMNHLYEYAPSQSENQLLKWNDLGMFHQDIGASNLPNFPSAPYQYDTTADLETRARIYLDVNCAYCHNPAAGTPANFDASFLTPLDETGMIYERPGNSMGLPSPNIITPGDTNRSVLLQRIKSTTAGIAMPPIAKRRVDREGVELIKAWIMSIDPSYRPDPLASLASNLVLFHKMDVGSGTISPDETSFQNDGTLRVGATWGSGNQEYGINFDGGNDHIEIPHDPSLAITDAITLSAWVKVDVFGSWDGVITKGINTSPYALQLWADRTIRFTANWGSLPGESGGGSFNSNGRITANNWHHIALTYDGSYIKFYLDGNLDTEISNPGIVFGQNTESLIIGADFPGGDDYFDGTMDEVRIFNKALTESQIGTIMFGNRKPQAAFTITANPNSDPLSVTLDASSSADPDGNALTYNWNMGEGSTSIEPLFNHTFPYPGDFSIQLIVDDGEFKDTLTQDFSVNCQSPVSFTPLIDLNAQDLLAGRLSTWQNEGSLSGNFDASGSNPSVIQIGGRNAVSFDGSQAMISNFLSPTGITGNESFTVYLEVFNPGVGNTESVFSWGHRGGPAGTNAQFMYGANTTWGATGHWGASDMGFDGGTPPAGAWHKIVYVYDGGVNALEKVYVNDVLNAQEIKSLNIHPNQAFHIGAARISPTGGLAEYFSGAISRIQVFDEALSQSEVASLGSVACPEIAIVRIKAMLQGPYNGTDMDDDLRSLGSLASIDPYGAERTTVPGLFDGTGNSAIVDWVQIELREVGNLGTSFRSKIGLIRRDGQVVDESGNPEIVFPGINSGSYHIVLRHYNHLAVMTQGPIDLTSNSLIDFSNPTTPTYSIGADAQFNEAGVMLMWSGDANGNGRIDAIDKNLFWLLQNGAPYNYGANSADFNLDGLVNALDLNLIWRINNSRIEQIL